MPIDLKRLTNLAATVKERAQTVADARNSHRWYRITNQAGSRAEVYIYDAIGLYGVEASAFVAEWNQISADEIDLHIASEGGEVWDGLTIYAAIKSSKAHVTAYIDSLAASAASFIAMAADTVKMERTARMMIHEAAGAVLGNAKDMRDIANVLDDMSDNIASIYAEKAGGDPKAWRKKMSAETWFTAEKALAEGLVDEIIGSGTSTTNKASATITNEVVVDQEPVVVFDAAQLFNAIKEGIA